MDEEYKQALSAALRLVSHHDRTECELRKKLSDRGFQEEVIESVVCRLIDDNFINDRRYTEYICSGTDCVRAAQPGTWTYL